MNNEATQALEFFSETINNYCEQLRKQGHVVAGNVMANIAQAHVTILQRHLEPAAKQPEKKANDLHPVA